MSSNNVMAYCFPCKAKVPLERQIKLIKRKLPNGNVVTILCGKCNGCKVKSCKIISNIKPKSKAKPKRKSVAKPKRKSAAKPKRKSVSKPKRKSKK